MDRNMSDLDRLLRALVVAPAALVGASLAGWTTVAGAILAAIAIVMLVTAVVGFCPLYALLRIRTKPRAL